MMQNDLTVEAKKRGKRLVHELFLSVAVVVGTATEVWRHHLQTAHCR